VNPGVVAKGLRTGEIVLSVMGISLLCWALAAVVPEAGAYSSSP